MNSSKYVLLIMNCVKYKDKATHQKNTWLKTLTSSCLPYYHVLGDSSLQSKFKFDDEERILWVNTPDDYNSLPKKVIAAYEAIHKSFPNIEYVLKTDDDQMLQSNDTNKFFTNIFRLLEKGNHDSKIHYAGNIVDVPQSYLSQYHRIHPELPEHLPVYSTKYCSGRFYLLSKDAILNLLTKKEQINNEYLEDYAIGFNLSEPYKITMHHLKTDMFFKDMV